MANRSGWKAPFVDEHLLRAAEAASKSTKKVSVKTWSRRSTILPIFVGLTFEVYNGKKFIPVEVRPHMVGNKLGAFAPTRTFHGHGANKKAVRV